MINKDNHWKITKFNWYMRYRLARMGSYPKYLNRFKAVLYVRDQDPIKFIQSPRLRVLIKKNYTRYIFKEFQKANERFFIALGSVIGSTNKILEDMPFIEAPHIDETPR